MVALVASALIVGSLLIVGIAAATPAVAAWEPIVRLTEVGYPTARCIDGTSGAYYLRRPAVPSDGWLWYFEGGGWCTSENSCYYRARTPLGSSVNYTTRFEDDHANWAGGLFSDDCAGNPLFCQFNMVYVKYCDGNSFGGAREAPVVVKGKPLHFRGAAIRDAVIDRLLKQPANAGGGLANATEFLLSGCSAGATAAYMHSDHIAGWLAKAAPRLRKFRTAPLSGFFLDHTNLLYESMYATQMRTIFELSHAVGGLGQTCLQQLPNAEQWRCQFAAVALSHSAVPTMVLNSKTDMAYTVLQFLAFSNGSIIPPYNKCHRAFPFPFHGCFDEGNIQPLLGLEADYHAKLFDVAGLLQPRNGYFISSCFTHCEGQLLQNWNGVRIGGTSMRQATEQWWHASLEGVASVEASDAATGGVAARSAGEAHRYIDCAWTATPPFFCNPSCPVVP
jgi:hypothetical protein